MTKYVEIKNYIALCFIEREIRIQPFLKPKIAASVYLLVVVTKARLVESPSLYKQGLLYESLSLSLSSKVCVKKMP